MKKWMLCIVLQLVMICQLLAQGQGSPYAPLVTPQGKSPDGQTFYLIVYPKTTGVTGFMDEIVLGDNQLSDRMQSYAASFQQGGSNYALVQNQATSTGGSYQPVPSGYPSPGGLNGMLGKATDFIDKELGNVLGEEVSSIMQGITDEIKSLASSLIADAIDASPIGEVSSLRDMLKEAYSKQQKIEYQQYKVKYTEKLAQTKLSSTFTKYYDALDLNGKLKKVSKQVGSINTLLANKVFSAKERQGISQALGQASDTSDLENEVKTACNLNGEEVWMSEAERIKVLDAADEQITQRARMLDGVRVKLTNAMTYRLREVARNKAVAGMYKDNTALNRRVGTTPKSL